MAAPPPPPAPPPSGRGVAFALGAFAIWGLFPVYFKLVAAVPAVEVLAHRIAWSAAVAALMVTVLGRWAAVRAILADRRAAATLALSGSAVTLNWGIFIFAIADGRVLEASLGYFINPLVSVFLGIFVLGERLRAPQWAAVALAAAGVAWQGAAVGAVPWVALALALSFGAYGLVRKVAQADALTGLFIETALVAPLALAYLAALAVEGSSAFGAAGWRLDALLAASGLITAMPLLLFVAGARRIPLSTLGLLQYLVPTGHFLLAVFAYGEPLTTQRLASFAVIWLALAVFTADALRPHRPGGRR